MTTVAYTPKTDPECLELAAVWLDRSSLVDLSRIWSVLTTLARRFGKSDAILRQFRFFQMEGVSLWFDKTKQAQSVGFPHKAFSLHRQGPPGRKTIPDSSIDREKSNIAAFVTNSSFSEHHPENRSDLWSIVGLQKCIGISVKSRLILFQTSIAQGTNAKIHFSSGLRL